MTPSLTDGSRRTALALLLAGLLVALTAASGAAAAGWTVVLRESFSGYPAGEPWLDGSLHGNWRADFDGYGTTEVRKLDYRVLSQRPQVSTAPGETHASLVTTRARYGDLDLSVKLRTVRQLRTGSAANPWEVAWVLWSYTDNLHFYYLVLKPNGWELGKEDPAYPGAQRFLATGNGSFPVGQWHTVRVQQIGDRISVWANGTLLTQLQDTERPYLSGRVGLYNEDAEVRFTRILISTRP
jgi:hypothetical protein